MDVSVNLLFLKFNLLENLLGSNLETFSWQINYCFSIDRIVKNTLLTIIDTTVLILIWKKKRTTYTLCVQVLPDYRINKETKRAVFYYALKKGKKEYQPYQREIVLSYDLAAVIFIAITRFNSDI